MHSTLANLIDRLERSITTKAGVIQWGAPIPSFGDLGISEIATVGINPSNREFMDEVGVELEGAHRRFHTLNSLGLQDWHDADSRHLALILESCQSYFSSNPYITWFKRLDKVLSNTGFSFFGTTHRACHLDLIPYATRKKWSELSGWQRSALLSALADTLGLLIRDSPVRVVILNGRSVVENFEAIAHTRLSRSEMPTWTLPRRDASGVAGISYSGVMDRLSGISLGRRILVLGYNHNLQSSFGVTSNVVASIRDWISGELEAFYET